MSDCPKCKEMHRRAQAAESAAARVIRQNDTERLWATVAMLKWRAEWAHRGEMRWRGHYRDVVKTITSSGLVPVYARPGILEGRLDVLVRNLIDRASWPWWRRMFLAAESEGVDR